MQTVPFGDQRAISTSSLGDRLEESGRGSRAWVDPSGRKQGLTCGALGGAALPFAHLFMSADPVSLHVVDAFTSVPFRGNPAAVCLPGRPVSEAWMQAVAAEMNLSETAFVVPVGEAWSLRWFTPAAEVALCGHATLASAHVLWETGRLNRDNPALFDTRQSGRLVCRRGEAGWIRMDFPASPVESVSVPEGLERALGAKAVWVGRSAYDYLVRVADESCVRGLRPDLAALAALPVRGVIVTAAAVPGGGGFDFVSRFFAPGVGVPEDPVTGSAHCALAPYWGAILGRTEMRGWQASARGGEVRVVWRGDRVELAGQAVTVSAGAWVGGED